MIDDTAPIVDTPHDINFEYSEIGNSITWEVHDHYLESYEVYDCGDLYSTGELFTDTTLLTIEISGLPVGSHNFTLVVYDTSGNSVSDSVWVSVLPLVSNSIDETDESTDIDNSTDLVLDTPMQFIQTLSEEIIAIFSGWLIGGVAVLSVFLIISRPKK